MVVMGILERGGNVRAQVIPNRHKETLQPIVKENLETGTELFTDELWGYYGLSAEYKQRIVDHGVGYVDGKIHTNGLENFWSLLEA